MDKLNLDIGCGGRGSMYPGFIGVDQHPLPLAFRTDNKEYISLDFTFLPALPWEDETADEIVCFHVIEHLDGVRELVQSSGGIKTTKVWESGYHEGAELLRRIYALLKPGASAYVSCPDNFLFTKMYLAAVVGPLDEKEAALDFWRRVYPKNKKEMWPGISPLARLVTQMRNDKQFDHRTPYDLQTLFIVATELAGIPSWCVRGLPKDHFWSRRPDHECGIIITKPI